MSNATCSVNAEAAVSNQIVISLPDVRAKLTNTLAEINKKIEANKVANAEIIEAALKLTIKNRAGTGINGKVDKVKLGDATDLIQAEKAINSFLGEIALAQNTELVVSRQEAKKFQDMIDLDKKEVHQVTYSGDISFYAVRD